MIIKYFIAPLLLLVLSVTLISPVQAEGSREEQAALQKKINSASSTLKIAKKVSKKLKKNVVLYENKLHNISRDLHKTERKISRLSKSLVKSNNDRVALEKQVEIQKTAIGQQIQALYIMGKDSHLRLLLKQDDPSDINRNVKYFEYLNQYRIKQIKLTQKKIKKLEILHASISKDTQALNVLQKKQRQQKSSLKNMVKEKERAFKKQGKIVLSKKKKLARLVKEEAQLKNLIRQLARKREKKRLARIKNQRASKKIRAKKTSQVKSKPALPSPKKVVSAKKVYVSNKPFSSLKGKLYWPVKGSLTHSYGSVKNSKQKWKGVIISAPRGRSVHAVARGTVEFSARLDGYGHLIIIRHDKNYRSLYAHNQGRYKKEGDIVKAGEVIASVGNSGGQSKTGVYFEIRKGTAYQNPARWCRKKR